MRPLVVLFLVLTGVIASTWAVPASYPEQSEDFTESKTVSAIQKWLTPFIDWFRNELPQKTPSQLFEDAKDTARDFSEWAQNNSVIQGIRKAVQPIHSWVKDKGNTLKDMEFRDMYGNAKETVSNVDNQVGGWIDKNIN